MKNPSNQNKERPIVILVWGDTPTSATGFATVVRNIFTPLVKTGRFEVDILGINETGGWKDPRVYPFRIFPARNPLEFQSDFHGRPRLISAMSGKDPDLKPPWDIIFTINDPFILEEPLPVFNKGTMEVMKQVQDLYRKKSHPETWFKIASYWPIDSAIRGNWVEKGMALADVSVAYSHYGVKEIAKADKTLPNPTKMAENLPVIYHGVNTKEFFPVSDEDRKQFRKEYFAGKVPDDTFIVTAVARNQMRKDLPRTMQIFREFQKRRPNSFLYLHAQENDAWGSLREYARNYNLEIGKDWSHPDVKRFNSNFGLPIELVNMIYNASDAIISTSQGEGFGFYNFEAMATKTPVLGPNNTVHPEIYGYDEKADISDMDKLYQVVRGVPMKAGSTSSEWATYGPADMMRPRPLVNTDDAVKKLLWVYDNPDKVKEITDRAYDWVQGYTWDKVVPEWDKLFTDVYNTLKDERKEALKTWDQETLSEQEKSKPTQ